MKSLKQWRMEETIQGKDPNMFKMDGDLEPWQEEWLLNIARRHGFDTVAKMLLPLVHPAGHEPVKRQQSNYSPMPDSQRPGRGNLSPGFDADL